MDGFKCVKPDLVVNAVINQKPVEFMRYVILGAAASGPTEVYGVCKGGKKKSITIVQTGGDERESKIYSEV